MNDGKTKGGSSRTGQTQAAVYVDRTKWKHWTEILKKRARAQVKGSEFVDADTARLEGVEQAAVTPTTVAQAQREYLRLVKGLDRFDPQMAREEQAVRQACGDGEGAEAGL